MKAQGARETRCALVADGSHDDVEDGLAVVEPEDGVGGVGVPGGGSCLPAAGAQVNDGVDGQDVECEAQRKPEAVDDCSTQQEKASAWMWNPLLLVMHLCAQITAGRQQKHLGRDAFRRTWDDIEHDANDGQQQHDWGGQDVGDIALQGNRVIHVCTTSTLHTATHAGIKTYHAA